MNFGFVIDNRSCIGCHACSTACKSENEVPLGVARTWVKTVEAGRYPDSRRHFQVTRCNHCANPPCVRICPTSAMYQRSDGIVEFDGDRCIGCKACMQACPYDAIYIDPDTHTAAKCHYCSHRVDIGLEPSCVVVCPEHAIIAGDLDDPDSEISRVVAKEKVTVRKPEQGTSPKVFYIEGAEVSLTPTATERAPGTFLFADVLPLHDGGSHSQGPSPQRAAEAAGGRRATQPQGLPDRGPLMIGEGRMADHMVQVAWNQQHKVPWHWPVPAYLVTKGVSAGIFLVLALAQLTGLATVDGAVAAGAGLLSLVALAATGALLVADLERPERFYTILLRPQWNSWLARGAVIITAFGGLAGLWWLGATWAWWSGGAFGLSAPLLAVSVPVAVGTAVYTAFLFGQAEGRDLWQSPLLPAHLLIQAVLAGAAALLLLNLVLPLGAGLLSVARWSLAIALLVDLFVALPGEFGMSHATEVAARAAHDITHGRWARSFWLGVVGVGHVLPLVLLMAAGFSGAMAAAGALALVGLYLFEEAWVMAPQDVPNS